MSDLIETFEAHGCAISIHYDEDAESPRENQDNFGTIAHWHRHYHFGTRIDDPPEFLRFLAREFVSEAYPEALFEKRWQEILRAHYVIRPVSLLDHSGLHIWVGSGSHWSDAAGWDSGQVGFIYCTLAQATENWTLAKDGHPNATWNFQLDDWDKGGKKTGQTITLREAAKRLLESEIKEYDAYLLEKSMAT